MMSSPILLFAVLLIACGTSDHLLGRADTSLDYGLEPDGGHSGYVNLRPGMAWRDSSNFTLRYRPDRGTVGGAQIRYRVSAGTVNPGVDTSSDQGHTGYVWVLPLDGAVTGEVFACVEATDGCIEQRLAGFDWTPGVNQ